MLPSHAFLLVSLLLQLPLFLQAHGYLSSPPPRGIEKESYQVDDLKSPNRKGLCRGEKEGKITSAVPGGSLTLGLTITAPHTGICTVSLLDLDLTHEQKFDEKFDCAAPGKVAPWTVKLPNNVSGRKVLRWYWEGCHVSPCEKYEQCIDLDFGGATYGGDGHGSPPPPPNHDEDHHDDHHDDHRDDRHDDHRDDHRDEAPHYDDKRDDDRMPPPSSLPAPFNGGHEGEKIARVMKKNSAIQRQVNRMLDSKRMATDAPPTRTRSPKSLRRSNQRETRHDPSLQQQQQQQCQDGQMKCEGDGHFSQCVYGRWSKTSCAPGTVCKRKGRSITCGWQ